LQVFSSAGDCSDILYSLPALEALGGGALRLVPAPYTTTRMTPAIAEALAALLRPQPYVADCRFAEAPEGVDLDGWRRTYRADLNVADQVCQALGVPPPPARGAVADRAPAPPDGPRPAAPQRAQPQLGLPLAAGLREIRP
jgi:hypothetical protein